MQDIENSLWLLLLLLPLAGLVLANVLTEGRRGRYWAGLASPKSPPQDLTHDSG